jgi:hypothetical protein
MAKRVTCSWCHEENDLRSDGGKVYCWSCAHRADVPRMKCDCRVCRTADLPIPVAAKKPLREAV